MKYYELKPANLCLWKIAMPKNENADPRHCSKTRISLWLDDWLLHREMNIHVIIIGSCLHQHYDCNG